MYYEQEHLKRSGDQEFTPFFIYRPFLYIFNELSYYQPMTKEQFFEDRPWLQQDDQIYKDYLEERIINANEILHERKDQLVRYSFEERKQKLYEKKCN